MSRIVICSREWSSSTGRYVRNLIKYLEKIDHNNEYLVLLSPEDFNSWEPISPNFHKIVCPYKEFSFAEQTALKRQIESMSPDLVHFTMVQQPIFLNSKIKVITTMHDLTTIRFKNPSKNPLIFAIKQIVYKKVNKLAAKKSKIIIVPSKFVKEDIVTFTGVDPSKVVVTYESADPILDKPKSIKKLQGKFIMYVGRPTPHKNLDRLISAFILIKKTHPDLKLVLAGKKDVLYSRIEQRVIGHKIDDIIFTGLVSEGQLKWLYSNCEAYIYPSLSEGFGLPGLEAMVHKAPVVSSNFTCLPEIYGDAALYFNPLSEEDMAAKITEVLDDNPLRQKLIKAGLEQASKYSWRKMAQQTLDIYSNVLKDY